MPDLHVRSLLASDDETNLQHHTHHHPTRTHSHPDPNLRLPAGRRATGPVGVDAAALTDSQLPGAADADAAGGDEAVHGAVRQVLPVLGVCGRLPGVDAERQRAAREQSGGVWALDV